MACCAVKLLYEFMNSLCLTQLAMLCSCCMSWGAARCGRVASSSCRWQRVASSKVCIWLVSLLDAATRRQAANLAFRCPSVAAYLTPAAEQACLCLCWVSASPTRTHAGDLEDVGPAAQEFIRRALPLLNVPWHVKEALEAAGIPGLKEVTPTVVRSVLDLCRSLKRPSFRPCWWPLPAFCSGSILG